MYIEVHSALSSYGYVVGGAETILKALKNIVTTDGALIMPAFPLSEQLELTESDKKNELVIKLKILDESSNEKTGMGIIADTFKNDPKVIVVKGLHRVAAWGCQAEINSKNLRNLHAKNGYALLLGVDIYKLTSMHYAETNMPEQIIN